jgi:hypothetical protein
VADHLLEPVGEHILPIVEKVLLDPFNGRLAKLRGRFQTGDILGFGQERLDALAQLGIVE